MNELIYVFQENKVRVTSIDTEPWFALVDVCAVLGIKNSRDVWNRLDDDEKAGVDFIDTSSNGVTQRRKLQAVNEPGLYDTIIRSNSEQANRLDAGLPMKLFLQFVRQDTIRRSHQKMQSRRLLKEWSMTTLWRMLYSLPLKCRMNLHSTNCWNITAVIL